MNKLVVNALAEDVFNKPENLEQLKKELTPYCACTEFKLNKETPCVDGFNITKSLNVTDLCKQLASLVKKETASLETGTALSSPETDNTTTKAANINVPIGCSCVYNEPTAENAKKTMNCSISNKTKDFLKNLPEAENMLNSYCQNLTYESLSKPDTEKSEYNKKLTHVISTVVCKSYPIYCVSETLLDLTVITVKEMCARSNVSLGLTPTKSKDKIFTPILLTKDSGAFGHLCESIKQRFTELYEGAQQNVTDFNAVTTALIINTTAPSKNVTTKAANIKNVPIGCSCVNNTPTAENAKTTLNCSISNETKVFLKDLPEAEKKYNSYCQNLTYESLAKSDTDKFELNEKLTHVISTFICELDRKICVQETFLNLTVKTVIEICARSNVSLGLTPTKSKDKDFAPILAALLTKESGAIDHLCESIKIRYTDLNDVAQENVTVIKAPTKNNQTNVNVNITSKQAEIPKPAANTVENMTKNATQTPITPSRYVRPPPENDQPATNADVQYATGTVIGVIFCAIALGSLSAVAARMSCNRYKRQTYVNQVRP